LACLRKKQKIPLLKGTIVISRHEYSKFAETMAEVFFSKRSKITAPTAPTRVVRK
jgi:hypothetical protein